MSCNGVKARCSSPNMWMPVGAAVLTVFYVGAMELLLHVARLAPHHTGMLRAPQIANAAPAVHDVAPSRS